MKRLLLAFVLVVLAANLAKATTYYYQSGNMNALASWNTVRDGSGSAPGAFAGNTFVIQNGQSTTANSSWTSTGPGTILIETGGSMSQSTFTPTFTLNMQSGASYTTGANFSTVTFGTLDAASTFIYTGTSTTFTSSSGASRSYGNLNLQSSTGTWTPGNLTTNGTLTLASSVVQGADTNTNQTWNIGSGSTGDIAISNGATLRLNNAGAANTATATFNISGGLTNDGTINKNSAGTTSTAVNFIGTGSSNVKWGTVTNTGFSSVSFNIASTKTIVFTDSLNEGAAAFTVNGTLNIGSQVLSGTSGTFTLGSGATFITSNATGLNGSITATGTKTFSTGANYEFQGAGTGTLLPSTVNDLAINRSSGNVTLDGGSATQTVSGTLNVYSGNLAAGTTTNTISAGSLVMRNAQINSGVTVNLNGNASFDSTNNGTATIAGALGLGSSTRTFTIANGSASTDMSITGQITDSSGLIKAGAGTLDFSGNNTYSGGTTVNAGTLTASHANALGTDTATIHSGGTLAINNVTIGNTLVFSSGSNLSGVGASNTIGGNFSGSATLSGPLSLASSATYAWSIGDLLTLNSGSTLNIDPAFHLSLASLTTSSFTTNTNQSWTVINGSSGTITGTALNLTGINGSFSGLGTFNYNLSANTLDLTWTASAIPEPCTYAAILGVVSLTGALIRRRRLQAAQSGA